MSTLGDLLAEHTVLPGNAVDHLHAVVGEWQLLADLSFADYLMWVRRDDGVLVCVAQCRPNTAPTVLQTDAVGSVVAADRAAARRRRPSHSGSRLHCWNSDAGARTFVGSCPARTSRPPRCDMATRWWRCSRSTKPRWRPTACPATWRPPTATAPRTSCTCSRRAPFPTCGTWPCRAPRRGWATASSASMSTASSPTPAPTPCRPITGWG